MSTNNMDKFNYVCDGQMSFDDLKKTNLDKLKEAKNGAEFIRIYEFFHGGCSQHGPNAKEIWKKHCLAEEYRGIDGCRKCREEFWDAEYKEGDE